MSHENSDTILRDSGYYNVYGGTQYPLNPQFGFERSRYPDESQAVNAAQWRSQIGGGPEGGASPQYGFTDRPNPIHSSFLGEVLSALETTLKSQGGNVLDALGLGRQMEREPRREGSLLYGQEVPMPQQQMRRFYPAGKDTGPSHAPLTRDTMQNAYDRGSHLRQTGHPNYLGYRSDIDPDYIRTRPHQNLRTPTPQEEALVPMPISNTVEDWTGNDKYSGKDIGVIEEGGNHAALTQELKRRATYDNYDIHKATPEMPNNRMPTPGKPHPRQGNPLVPVNYTYGYSR